VNDGDFPRKELKMEIAEVQDLLNSFRLLGLLAPQHVFLTDEPIYEQSDGRTFFRGLSPRQKRGTIILSKQADVTTVPHEWVHSALGLGELAAYPIGYLFALKYQFTKNFPLFTRLKLLNVKYQEDQVPSEYRGRVKYYIRVK